MTPEAISVPGMLPLQGLVDGVHVHQRVGLPAAALLLVGRAAVEVRGDVPVYYDADRRAELAAFGEVGAEGVAQRPNRGSQ